MNYYTYLVCKIYNVTLFTIINFRMPNSNGITPARAASENEHVTVFMKLKKNGAA